MAPDRPPLRLLVTAFGPFPGVPLNPSEQAARDLLRRRPALRDAAIHLAVLPTRWAEDKTFARLLAQEDWDGVLMLGVAARRRRVCLETRAVNAARAAPDAAGRHPPSRHPDPRAPAVLRSRLPAAAWAAGLSRAGVAAAASRDAGRYLCNARYFQALAAAQGSAGRRRAPVPVLFIHLPGRDGRPDGVTRAQLARGLSHLLVAFAAAARRAAA